MGNKIITEKDFWICTQGNVPAQLQGTREGSKKKSGEKYITVEDKATSSWIDFGCKKYMLLMAIVAAVLVVGAVVIGVVTVATGGAALIAIGALAGLGGATIGAVMGGLLCGQKMGGGRKWLGSKKDLIIQGSPGITGGHQMKCKAGGVITFAPHIKNWSQAISLGVANYIGGLMEGMMGGAVVGMGGAALSGGASAFVSAGWKGLGRAALNFGKSIPTNLKVNFIESFSKFGLGLRGVMGVQNTAATYGNTGEASVTDFAKGTVGLETGAYGSVKNIVTGQGTWQDWAGMAMMIAPVGQGKRELEDSLFNKEKEAKAKDTETTKDGDNETAKVKSQEGEAPAQTREAEAFEGDSMKREARYNAEGERMMTSREFKDFRKKMADLGIKIELDTKGKILGDKHVAGFDSSKKTLYLKKPPKTYDAMHEGFHAEQWSKLGDEAYNKQTRLEKETYVYEQLMKNKEILTPQQINHAEAYIYYVENGYWPYFNKKINLYEF